MATLRERVRGFVSPATTERAVSPNGDNRSDGFEGQESFGGPDPLMYDNAGWTQSGVDGSGRGNDIRPIDRITTVRRARLYYQRDAMSQQGVRLTSAYVIGRGVSIKARDYTQGSDDESVVMALQKEADRFWEHPDNSYTFEFEAQQRNSDKLSVDGELFFLLFLPEPDDDDNVTRARVLDDCLQIVKVIKNPEDESEPWYYLRRWTTAGNVEKSALYPDYRLFLRDDATDPTLVTLPLVPKDADVGDARVQESVFVRHVKVNTIGDRGSSNLTAAMDWSKVNREYLEDRATISKAHSRIAWMRKVKGPASAVASFGKRALSGVSGNAAVAGQYVPSAPAGMTMTTNDGVGWEAMNANDGGKNAYTESRNFRLMVQMAFGYPEHYFADGSMGTRATSKSMERPVELILTLRQTLWKRAYESLFAFHLNAIGREYDAHAVWVDAPQILEDDTATIVNSFISLFGVLPGFNVDELVIRLLNAFGIDDPQDVLVKIRDKEKEIFQQRLDIVFAQAGLDPNGLDQNDPASVSKFVVAQQKVISMLTAPGDSSSEPGPKKGPQFGSGSPGSSLVVRKPSPPKMKITDPNG